MQEVSSCSRPLNTNGDPNKGHLDFVTIDDGSGNVLKYRLYVYETRLIQMITFKIEAMAEGGKRFETPDLILNVTCPGFVSV